jgi:hypothetical protein
MLKPYTEGPHPYGKQNSGCTDCARQNQKIVKLYKPTKHNILSLSRQIDSKNGEKRPHNFPTSRETATFTLKHLLNLLIFYKTKVSHNPSKPFPKPPKNGKYFGKHGKNKNKHRKLD